MVSGSTSAFRSLDLVVHQTPNIYHTHTHPAPPSAASRAALRPTAAVPARPSTAAGSACCPLLPRAPAARRRHHSRSHSRTSHSRHSHPQSLPVPVPVPVRTAGLLSFPRTTGALTRRARPTGRPRPRCRSTRARAPEWGPGQAARARGWHKLPLLLLRPKRCPFFDMVLLDAAAAAWCNAAVVLVPGSIARRRPSSSPLLLPLLVVASSAIGSRRL